MEEPIHEREEPFWRLFYDSPTGVALFDLAGRVEASNPALCGMLNCTAEDIVDNWLADLVHPIYRPEMTQLVQDVIRGERREARSEMGLVRRDGTLASSRVSLFLARNRQGEPEYGLALFELVPSERKVLDAIHLLATTDELTGLYNRRGFFLLAEQQWRLTMRKQRELSLIYLDLDGLKTINDTLGHRAGDEAIRGMAEILRGACREMDVVARMGGDEFCVLMVESGEAAAKLLCSRLRQGITAYNAWQKHPFTLSASLGAAHLTPGETRSIEELLAEADRQMYIEKKSHHRAPGS